MIDLLDVYMLIVSPWRGATALPGLYGIPDRLEHRLISLLTRVAECSFSLLSPWELDSLMVLVSADCVSPPYR